MLVYRQVFLIYRFFSMGFLQVLISYLSVCLSVSHSVYLVAINSYLCFITYMQQSPLKLHYILKHWKQIYAIEKVAELTKDQASGKGLAEQSLHSHTHMYPPGAELVCPHFLQVSPSPASRASCCKLVSRVCWSSLHTPLLTACPSPCHSQLHLVTPPSSHSMPSHCPFSRGSLSIIQLAHSLTLPPQPHSSCTLVLMLHYHAILIPIVFNYDSHHILQ